MFFIAYLLFIYFFSKILGYPAKFRLKSCRFGQSSASQLEFEVTRVVWSYLNVWIAQCSVTRADSDVTFKVQHQPAHRFVEFVLNLAMLWDFRMSSFGFFLLCEAEAVCFGPERGCSVCLHSPLITDSCSTHCAYRKKGHLLITQLGQSCSFFRLLILRWW